MVGRAGLRVYGHILKWGVSVVFITNAPRYKPRVRVIPRAYGAGDDGKRVTRVSQFTAMEQERSKGSESGKRCTRACTSYVASGVEKAKLRGHLQSAGYCILCLRLE